MCVRIVYIYECIFYSTPSIHISGKLIGKSGRHRDYDVKGSKVDKIFNGFGAISAIIVCNNSGMVPEIQVRISLYHL